MANGNHVIQLFDEFAPKHLAVEGDKIGLQILSLIHISEPTRRS